MLFPWYSPFKYSSFMIKVPSFLSYAFHNPFFSHLNILLWNNNQTKILSLLHFFFHLNILLLILNYHVKILSKTIFFFHSNILLRILHHHDFHTLFLFHFFSLLNTPLRIIINQVYKNHILFLFRSIFFRLKILLRNLNNYTNFHIL